MIGSQACWVVVGRNVRGRNVEGIELIVGICSMCSEGVGCVGVGAGVTCGCHATFADTIVGSNTETDADSLILTSTAVLEGAFELRPLSSVWLSFGLLAGKRVFVSSPGILLQQELSELPTVLDYGDFGFC